MGGVGGGGLHHQLAVFSFISKDVLTKGFFSFFFFHFNF